MRQTTLRFVAVARMPMIRKEGAVVATSSSEVLAPAPSVAMASQPKKKGRRDLPLALKAEILNFSKGRKNSAVLQKYTEISESTLKRIKRASSEDEDGGSTSESEGSVTAPKFPADPPSTCVICVSSPCGAPLRSNVGCVVLGHTPHAWRSLHQANATCAHNCQ